MIEKLKIGHQYGCIYETAPNNLEITEKINEIIDYINEYPIITTPKKTADYTITRTEIDND